MMVAAGPPPCFCAYHLQRFGFSGCNAPASYESESCDLSNAAMSLLPCFVSLQCPRDKEPLRLVLPSLGQTQLGARRGPVGELVKAIFAVFDATRAAAGDKN